MLRQTLHIVLHFLAAASALSACSLKEGRGECPGWYGIHAEAVEDVVVSFYDAAGGEVIYSRAYTREELSSGDNAVSLPVRDMAVCGVPSGIDLTGNTLTVPKGTEFPAVTAFSLSVPEGEGGEEYRIEAGRPCRQYADITVRVIRFDEGAMTVALAGSRNGFSLPFLAPVEGEYSFLMKSPSEGVFRARVPRQGDASLKATVSREGLDDAVVAVGAILEAEGYDWTAPDLVPAEVTVNLAGPIFNPFVDAEVNF